MRAELRQTIEEALQGFEDETADFYATDWVDLVKLLVEEIDLSHATIEEAFGEHLTIAVDKIEQLPRFFIPETFEKDHNDSEWGLVDYAEVLAILRERLPE